MCIWKERTRCYEYLAMPIAQRDSIYSWEREYNQWKWGQWKILRVYLAIRLRFFFQYIDIFSLFYFENIYSLPLSSHPLSLYLLVFIGIEHKYTSCFGCFTSYMPLKYKPYWKYMNVPCTNIRRSITTSVKLFTHSSIFREFFYGLHLANIRTTMRAKTEKGEETKIHTIHWANVCAKTNKYKKKKINVNAQIFSY